VVCKNTGTAIMKEIIDYNSVWNRSILYFKELATVMSYNMFSAILGSRIRNTVEE
jgi:hypothetical protein